MSEEKNNDAGLDSNLKRYVQVQYEILSLELSNRLASLAGWLVSGTILAICLLLALFFSSLTLAIFLTSLLNSYIGGLGITAAIFLVLFLLLVALKRRLLIEPVKDKIIRELFRDKD